MGRLPACLLAGHEWIADTQGEMTDTLHRLSRSSSAPASEQERPARRPVEAGVLGALWAGCAGLVAVAVPVLVVWAADPRSGAGAGAALRTAGQVWLVAHGAGLAVPGGSVGLLPLGLLLLPLALLVRAAAHGARQCQTATVRGAAALAVAVAVPYAVLAAVVAGLSATSAVRPAAWQALLAGLTVGLCGGFVGAVRGGRLWALAWAALPGRVRRGAVGSSAAVAVLLATGALLTVASLALHFGRASSLAASLGAGWVGGFALLVLDLCLLPNAAVWGTSWLAGPGFAVGTGTSVGPFGTVLGPVPSLPLLAALPGPVPAWVAGVTLVVPVLAGGWAGFLVVRRAGSPSWLWATREAVAAAAGAGVLAALLGWLSGGPVGGGRLAAVGPSPWRLGLAVAAEVAVGAVPVAVLVARRGAPYRPSLGSAQALMTTVLKILSEKVCRLASHNGHR